MTFYDYDLVYQKDGSSLHILRADMKRMPVGSCRVYPFLSGWVRKTCWRSPASTRYEVYDTLDAALTAGIEWAKRRTREDQREANARTARAMNDSGAFKPFTVIGG